LAVRRERLVQQNQSQIDRSHAHGDSIQACDLRLRAAQAKATESDARVLKCGGALETARDQLEATVSQERRLREELVTDRSRRDSLVEVERRRADLSDGSRRLLDADLGGRLGAISELVDVPVQYESAALAALGIHLDAVVMANSEAVTNALDLVSQDGMERVLVANADVKIAPTRHALPEGAAILGFLVDRIAPERHHVLLTYLLSDAVLVENAVEGERLVEQGWRGTVVTLTGERFEGQAVTFSGAVGDGAGPIGRRREIKELSARLDTLEQQHADLATSLDSLRHAQSTARQSLDTARVEARQAAIYRAEQQKEFEQLDRQRVLLEQATNRFQQDIGEIERDLLTNRSLEEDAKTRLREAEDNRGDRQRLLGQAAAKVSEAESVRDTAVGAMHDAKSRAMTASERLLSMRTLLSRLERQINEIQVRRDRVVSVGDDVEKRLSELDKLVTKDREQCRDAEEEAGRLADELATVRAEYATVRDRMGEVDTGLEQSRRKRDDIRQRLSDSKLEYESFRLRLETLELRMKERYQVEIEDALAASQDAQRPGPQQIIRLEELEALLEKMGEVNLGAIQEFETVEERFEFLTTQREDLLSALADLETAITEIDRTTKQLFTETFEAVRGHFRELFPRLFRGGEADLVLTEPDNLLATGINMSVCPPGKKIQSVELLSGGEKAMCAIALVFAVFRHRPSPFCLLDEVDAPLDDANIGRFNEVVREIAQQSQVVLVTHNKRTMEIADSLYGVTMEESGVSKLVGVRMS
jgi:chromosome segregation protein